MHRLTGGPPPPEQPATRSPVTQSTQLDPLRKSPPPCRSAPRPCSTPSFREVCEKRCTGGAPTGRVRTPPYFISIFSSFIFVSSKGGLRMGISSHVPFLSVDL